MSRHRYWLLALAVTLCVPLAATTAGAWEFTMTGAYVMEYDHVGQGGTNGFFGPHNIDASGLNRQQMNFYAGHEVGLDSTVSGLDAVVLTHWMYINPSIRINKAIKLNGQYYIGAWDFLPNGLGATGVPGTAALVASEYQNSVNRGVQNSFSPGYWNWLKLSVKLPWGNMSIGKRPSNFGLGLMNNGEENSTSNSLSLTAPYGPISVGISFYPARWGNEGYYNTYSDRSNNRPVNFAWGASYASGPLVAGFSVGHATRHRGGERTVGNAGNSREREDLDLGIYMKYNNGRFFLNAEAREYDRRDIFTFLAANGRRLYQDNETQAWAVETGCYAGPAKLAFIIASVSGIDRRAVDNSGTNDLYMDNTIATASPNFSNSGTFLPYSYLMVYSYSLGLGSNPQTGNGIVDAAFVYGARLDYAVAANLNTYGTFFYALRPSKGFGWGFLRPPTAGNVGGTINRTHRIVQGVRAPAIPDDFLGWEFDVGVDWKLLEGLIFSGRFAYWEVGDWFKYACVSMDNPGWPTPNAGNNWGTNPDRTIDPVYAWNVTLTAEF